MSAPHYHAAPNKRAWVAFTNQTEFRFLRLFKRGFRHCFVLIHDGTHWISIDPMAHYMEVAVQEVAPDFDLVHWLRQQGHMVVDAPLSQELRLGAPIRLFTCVEACKRVLGIHKMTILTPWQLYNHLNSQN